MTQNLRFWLTCAGIVKGLGWRWWPIAPAITWRTTPSRTFPKAAPGMSGSNDYDVTVDGAELTLDLPEYEAKVLVW